MTTKLMTIAMLAALFFNSCKETPKQENTESPRSETVEKSADDIVTSTSTDKDGKNLDVTYNNTNGTATINFNGETSQLMRERAASGIWYKNDTYELRGKGNDVTLTKKGKLVFEHTDDMVSIEEKNDHGNVLNMTFNNTEGTVKAYLNGGEQIDLVQKKAASGIWYSNDKYELRGKGDSYTLYKDEKVVFEN